MSKKFLSAVLALILMFSAVSFVSCSNANSDFKVGVILVGDETEGYTKAHMDGIKSAASALGLKDSQIIWKYKIDESDNCLKAAQDLAAQGCSLIISNSYGHQDYMKQAAEQFPDITFIAMTGDGAAASKLPNLKNAFTCVYESRYISGIVAGMKIKQLIDNGTLSKEKQPGSFDKDGNVKIGYVGAYAYAEVVSGYTAFYLGVKSVYDKVVMEVVYTDSWFDIAREGAAAEALMSNGAVIIGQHADSTGAPAAVQKALNNGKIAYSVGYNIDMIPTASTAALTSATNEWKVYYKYAIGAALKGETIVTDWAKGYSDDAVAITSLNTASVAPGTKEAVDSAIAAIKSGTLHVFDCSKFTVGGKHLTTYTNSWGMNGAETIVKSGDVYYFSESTIRSAPYFDIRIDGITENATHIGG
jgi:basic membrane protein A